MSKLYYKIHEYDTGNNIFLISFASDTTKSSNPDDYAKHYISPNQTWPNANTADDLLQCIIEMCKYTVEIQESNESVSNQDELLNLYMSFSGKAGEVDI